MKAESSALPTKRLAPASGQPFGWVGKAQISADFAYLPGKPVVDTVDAFACLHAGLRSGLGGLRVGRAAESRIVERKQNKSYFASVSCVTSGGRAGDEADPSAGRQTAAAFAAIVAFAHQISSSSAVVVDGSRFASISSIGFLPKAGCTAMKSPPPI